MKTIGEIIKEFRKANNLSLRELAKMTGLSHTYIDKLEKGYDPRTGKKVEPTMYTIACIAEAMKVPRESLLKEIGYIDNNNDDNPDHAWQPVATPKDENNIVMNRIKELRKEKGMTQAELAKILNVSDRSVGFYETGERDPDTETLNKLANFFDVSVDYLLGRTDIRNPYIPDDYAKKYKVTKRDLTQYEDFVQHANIFFMNDEVSDEDKEALFRDISELFWKSKEKNKQKYGRKKNTEGRK